MYTLLGNQAIDHLFRVSTGLDSMLIGEAEILAQVKDAFDQGAARAIARQDAALAVPRGAQRRQGGAHADRHRRPVDVDRDGGGQRARSRTSAICAARRSSSSVPARWARSSRAASRHEGCRDIMVLNRAARLGTAARDRDRWPHADIVVTSTGASDFVIDAGERRRGDARAARPSAVHRRHRGPARLRSRRRARSTASAWSTSTACAASST